LEFYFACKLFLDVLDVALPANKGLYVNISKMTKLFLSSFQCFNLHAYIHTDIHTYYSRFSLKE
jgi:hypothetical protein